MKSVHCAIAASLEPAELGNDLDNLLDKAPCELDTSNELEALTQTLAGPAADGGAGGGVGAGEVVPLRNGGILRARRASPVNRTPRVGWKPWLEPWRLAGPAADGGAGGGVGAGEVVPLRDGGV